MYILILLNNNNSPLWEQDEAAYAGFATNMIQSGNYIIPDFPFSDPHRKTPLHFWLITGFFKLFGNSEFTLRLSSVIFLLLTNLLTFILAQKMFDKKTSLYTVMILSGSFFLTLYGKVAFVDSALLLFETISVLGIYLLFKEKSSFPFFLLFIGMSLGILIKGPPIIILLLGIFIILTIFSYLNSTFSWKTIFIIPVIFLSLIPLLVWGRIAWLKDNGNFISWLIDWYILKRASGSVFGQTGPPGYYLILFFITLFPWSFLFPQLILNFWQFIKEVLGAIIQKTQNKSSLLTQDFNHQFLYSWLLTGWVFYEIIMSKLPSYVIGAYPAIAILLAKELINLEIRSKSKVSVSPGLVNNSLWLIPITGSALLILFSYIIYIYQLNFILFFLAFSILMLTFYAFYLFRLNQNYKAISFLAFTSLFYSAFIWNGIAPNLKFRHDSQNFSQKIQSFYPNTKTVVFNKNISLPGVAYYLRREGKNIQIVEDLQELKFYLDKNPVIITYPESVLFELENKLKPEHQFEIYAYDRDKLIKLSVYRKVN